MKILYFLPIHATFNKESEKMSCGILLLMYYEYPTTIHTDGYKSV